MKYLLEYYIAFSIHGTNCFISANKTCSPSTDGKTVIIDDEKFTIGKSRRDNFSAGKECKLIHADLSNKDGKPTRCPKKVMKFFNKLKSKGWNVSSDDFVKKHWKKN